jgi:hypothetical protein
MKQLIVFAFMALLLVSTSMAAVSIENDGFINECYNFYNNRHYYSIAKWEYSTTTNNYVLVEQNPAYRYINTDIKGDLLGAYWTSDQKVSSLLVNSGSTLEFNGGTAGSVDSLVDISHITICGYKNNRGIAVPACVGSDCSNNFSASNGVPEYSVLSLAAAVLAATLGLVFIRKR